MARIRTIKPEFPQSESMGRVSREARLCFIMLWTIADDAGRLRGNSRMLASLLYPYDDDAKRLIDKWLAELVAEGCISQYAVKGDSYVQINGWAAHQKIDHPSQSKLPSLEESRTFARLREASSEDQGEDQGREGSSLAPTVLVERDALDAKPYEVPDCPYEAIQAAYAERLPSLPQLTVVNEVRRGHMRGRWREVCGTERFTSAQGVEFFQWYFGHVAKSSFLTGNSSPRKDGRVWKADFDWLLLPTNFAKVVEGRYNGKAAA